MYWLWTCKGSDYKLSLCPAIKMKNLHQLGQHFVTQCYVRSVWVLATTLTPVFIHGVPGRAGLPHTHPQAALQEVQQQFKRLHQSTHKMFLVFFFVNLLSSSITWQPVKLEQWRGEERFAWQKVFCLFWFFFIIWNGDWNVKEQKVG